MKKRFLIFFSVFIVFPIICIGFVTLVKLPFSYDLTHAHRLADFGASRDGKIRVYAEGTVQREWLGILPLEINEPYRIEVCARNTIQQNLKLVAAKVARVVEGNLVPIEVEFDIDPTWRRANPGPTPGQFTVCASDLLRLDIKVDSREIFCVDIEFKILEVKQVERACFELTRKVSSFRATVWEIIGYSA